MHLEFRPSFLTPIAVMDRISQSSRSSCDCTSFFIVFTSTFLRSGGSLEELGLAVCQLTLTMVPAYSLANSVDKVGARAIFLSTVDRVKMDRACRVASQPLLLCVAEAPLAFTSPPGCTAMIPKDTVSPASCLPPEMVPEVHAISKDPLHYSIVSAPAAQRVRELESTIAIDPGEKKGIKAGETVGGVSVARA